MTRVFLVLAAASGFLSVALGAFGAHALKSRLSPDLLAIFQTGVQYQLPHTVALIATAWLAERIPSPPITAAGWAFVVGILLFSGSLYVLSLTGIRALGMVTPFGGLSFLVGWFLLGYGAWRHLPPM